MTNKHKNRLFANATSFVIDTIKQCKIKSIIITSLVVIALITGIIVGARTHNNYTISNNFGVVDISDNGVMSSTFFTRLLSMIVVFLILLASSYNNYTFVIGIIFLGYRAYLLGLNICLMVTIYGFSGIVVSVIVAFPCQLLTLLVLSAFFIMMSKTFCDYRSFGGCSTPKQKSKIILTTLCVLLLLCLLETLLLALFSAKVILVI